MTDTPKPWGPLTHLEGLRDSAEGDGRTADIGGPDQIPLTDANAGSHDADVYQVTGPSVPHGSNAAVWSGSTAASEGPRVATAAATAAAASRSAVAGARVMSARRS